MAFIILLQTLYKNCGNLRVLISPNFIYSHDKNKETIKNVRVNSTLLFRQSKKKIKKINLRQLLRGGFCEVLEPTKLGYEAG